MCGCSFLCPTSESHRRMMAAPSPSPTHGDSTWSIKIKERKHSSLCFGGPSAHSSLKCVAGCHDNTSSCSVAALAWLHSCESLGANCVCLFVLAESAMAQQSTNSLKQPSFSFQLPWDQSQTLSSPAWSRSTASAWSRAGGGRSEGTGAVAVGTNGKGSSTGCGCWLAEVLLCH